MYTFKLCVFVLLILQYSSNIVESVENEFSNDRDHLRANGCIESTGSTDGLVFPSEVSDNIFNVAELVDLTVQVPLTENDNPGYDTFEVFSDCDDLAIVASQGGVCYTVFRCTIATIPLDVLQLFDWSKKDIGTCTVRGGFLKAYYSRYYDDYIAAIDRCMASNSQLIIGGHSQGGSIAVVASIGLKHYNPYVVTFGAPRVVIDLCSDVDPNRHFRFVNALGGKYDEWPMMFNNHGMHVGHTIFLDHVAQNPAAYIGLNDNKSRSPSAKSLHDTQYSYDALSRLRNSGCSPLRISGWEDGHFCTGDEECNGYCLSNRCLSA